MNNTIPISESTFMINTTSISERMQEKNKKSSILSTPYPERDMQKLFRSTRTGYLSNAEINDIKKSLWDVGYTDKRMRVVEVVLSFFTQYQLSYFKIAYIARLAGVSHTTVETVMRDLQSMGVYKQDRRWSRRLIDGEVKSREVNSQWWLTDRFRDRNLLIALSYYFPFLKKFRALPLLMVLSASAEDSRLLSKQLTRSFEDHSYSKDFIYKTGTDTEPRNEKVTVGHPHNQYTHGARTKSIAGEYSTVPGLAKEKGREMYAKHIDGIRSLVLTGKGKAELSCFSEKAIQYTDNALYNKMQQESFSPLSAWKWFCKVATRYSKDHNLPLDYGLTFKLCANSDFKIEDANVESVAQVKKHGSTVTTKTGRVSDEKQPEAYTTTNEVVARVRDKVVSDGDKEHIEKKVKFFRAALKAAESSNDVQSRRCIPFYQNMLEGWEANLAQLRGESEPDNKPVMTKSTEDKQFLFGADDAPISEYDIDEESPWI